MKKIAATILSVLFGTSLTFAHQMEGGSTKGLFGLKAEYLHVLLNPLPVYGLSMGVLVLAAALLVRSKAARNIGLLLIVICAASAWPVLYFGQHGYNHLYPQLDTESQQWLDDHMERAERFVYAFYVTALLGIATLLTQKKFPKATKPLTCLTLAAAIAALGIGGWISRAGGEVSHSEFRNDDSPPPVSTEQHQMHDGMKMPGMTNDRKMEMPVHAPNEKMEMSKTPEQIWQKIHDQQSGLDSVIRNKNLSDVHQHVSTFKDAIDALNEGTKLENKAAFKSGTENISRLLSAVHEAADAGDQATAEAKLKEFDEALKQLEEQVNKQ